MGKTKKKDHRSASLARRQSTREVKQSFLIVCEGVRTEPDYFKAFRMTAATVKAVGQAMNTTSLVSKAISIRDADQKKKRTYDQCWVVQEYLIPRRKDSGLLCITVCSTCSHKPLRMPLLSLPMSHTAIRLWKNLPPPYICW